MEPEGLSKNLNLENEPSSGNLGVAQSQGDSVAG